MKNFNEIRLIALFYFVISSLSFLCGQTTFQLGLVKTDETIISDILVYNESRFIALLFNYNEIKIIKLDNGGNIVSSQIFTKQGARFTPEPKIFMKKNGEICLLVPENSGGVTSKILFYAMDNNLNIITSQILPNAYPFYDWKHIQEYDDGSIVLWVSNSKNTRLTIQGIKFGVSYNIIWNKEYSFENGDDLELRSSIIIGKDCYVLVRRFGNRTGSSNYNSVIKIDQNGNVADNIAFNFDPNHIDKDSKNNIVAVGTTNTNQLICTKLDNQFNKIWSKEIGFAKVPFLGEGKNALVAIEKGFVIDEFDNIYITIMEENLFEFDGTKLLKLTPEGDVSYSNILLDGEHKRVDKVLMMGQSILMKISSTLGTIITKLNNQLESTECSSMPFCPEISNFSFLKGADYEAIAVNGPAIQSSNPLILSNTEVSFKNFCKSIDQPYAYFNITQEKWCVGEFVKVDLASLYPRGRSIWQLIYDSDTTLQKTKKPEPFLLSKPGKYKILHTLIFAGCIYQDSISFDVSVPGTVILDRQRYLCFGDSLVIDLTPLNLTNILWYDGDNTQTKTIYETGTISLTYIDANGCPNEDKTTIFAQRTPEINLGDDVTLCQDSTLTIDPKMPEGVTLRWNNNETKPTLLITQKGYYTVVASNDCGEDSDDIRVDMIDCSTKVFYPNVFSPNGDGVNDIFAINTFNAENMSCSIFDRWGNLIFFQSGENITWDGKFKNLTSAVGVYTFVIEYTGYLTNKKEIISGNVTLLK